LIDNDLSIKATNARSASGVPGAVGRRRICALVSHQIRPQTNLTQGFRSAAGMTSAQPTRPSGTKAFFIRM